jgi:hypothetical protein
VVTGQDGALVHDTLGVFGVAWMGDRVIEIADEVYSTVGPARTALETIFLTGGFESAAGMQAIARVAERFMFVGADGVEYDDIEIPSDRGIYTPNYCSDPEMTEFGIEFYVDCKSVIPAPMRTTFRRILEEELRAARIDEARIVAAKLSYDERRMVPFDRDEGTEMAALIAWRESAFATSIELGADGRTVDFRIAQRVDWDGSARLRKLLHELVRRHFWAAQEPRSWPSHLENATDLPWRVPEDSPQEFRGR